MNLLRCLLALLALSALCAGAVHASPDTTPDPDADVVHLRIDCDVAGSPLENCFESMSAVTNWLWGSSGTIRGQHPQAGDEVLVDIGPGTFDKFVCDGQGYVTLRGSGREQTIISDNLVAMSIKNCQNLSFIDLGAVATYNAVQWVGSGFSSWSNTDMLVVTTLGPPSVSTAWSDNCDFPNLTTSEHYFHSTRVRAVGAKAQKGNAFYTNCAENWFFGGEIDLELSNNTFDASAILINASRSDLRLFGTAVRARITNPSASATVTPFRGVYVRGGMFHSHGGVVNVSASVSATEDAVAIDVTTEGGIAGHAHTPGTAFVLAKSASGTASRLVTSSGGVADSPYQWEPGSSPPGISSLHGQDLYVETDCESTDCTGGSDPHLMIYSTSCTGGGGPWFDVVRQACRVN